MHIWSYKHYNIPEIDPRVSQSLNDKENKCTCILRSCHLYMLYLQQEKMWQDEKSKIIFFLTLYMYLICLFFKLWIHNDTRIKLLLLTKK